MTRYLLDANVFIMASQRHYGFDFCPAFWDWLVLANAQGRVFSTTSIAHELDGDDPLSEWSAARGTTFFLPPDQPMLVSMGVVSDWVNQQSYTPAAKTNFLTVADATLIAHAHAHGYTLVTHEVPANSITRVKIPNVCVGVGVKYMTPFDMLRAEKARFVL